MDLLDDPWRQKSDAYVGPVDCVDIAAKNAGIELTLSQTRALAMELIAMGADFNA